MSDFWYFQLHTTPRFKRWLREFIRTFAFCFLFVVGVWSIVIWFLINKEYRNWENYSFLWLVGWIVTVQFLPIIVCLTSFAGSRRR